MKTDHEIQRPMPPESLLDYSLLDHTLPSTELQDWARATLLAESSPLFNGDHVHLEQATLGFLWTNAALNRKGRSVIGTAEQPTFRCNAWQKARQEQQLEAWFALIPDFIITLSAPYCAECSDIDFCALVDHELYHCAQASDEFGSPKFHKQTGRPSFELVGHDVEEFVGVVRRYGAGRSGSPLAQLIEAGKSKPEIDHKHIASACGICAGA